MFCTVDKCPCRESIRKGGNQNSCLLLKPEPPAHKDESTPSAVNLEQRNNVVADIHIFCREEYRKQCKRISYDIIVECLQYVGSLANIKIPLGNFSRKQCAQIIAIIGQSNEMLLKSIAAINKGCPRKYKTPIDKERENQKQNSEQTVLGRGFFNQLLSISKSCLAATSPAWPKLYISSVLILRILSL